MTTVALQVPIIRRLLQDRPVRAKVTAAITDTTTETFTTSAADATKFTIGELWEHDDSSGEQREITAVDVDTPLLTALRGANGSTAVTHLTNTYIIKDPRFSYDLLTQAINQCLDVDLYPHIYEIVEHEVTSSSTSYAYNAPSTSCEKWLDVYQRTVSTNRPERQGIVYTVYPQNVDTDLWANGLVFEITGGKRDGTEKYYVNCAHRLTIGTLLARQERILQMCAARYALEWSVPRRLGGPTNQGDRSVRPTDPLVGARYFEDQFRRLLRAESKTLKNLYPRRTVFARGTITYAHGD